MIKVLVTSINGRDQWQWPTDILGYYLKYFEVWLQKTQHVSVATYFHIKNSVIGSNIISKVSNTSELKFNLN